MKSQESVFIDGRNLSSTNRLMIKLQAKNPTHAPMCSPTFSVPVMESKVNDDAFASAAAYNDSSVDAELGEVFEDEDSTKPWKFIA